VVAGGSVGTAGDAPEAVWKEGTVVLDGWGFAAGEGAGSAAGAGTSERFISQPPATSTVTTAIAAHAAPEVCFDAMFRTPGFVRGR
jgi:hypothetical protein